MDDGARRGSIFPRVRATYTGVAIFLLNAVVLFVGFNLVVAWFHRGQSDDNLLWPLLTQRLPAIYPDLSPAERDELARAMLGHMVYEPYTDLAHSPVRGRFLNVDADGFRWGRERPPWPIEPAAYNVFAFGGSTTFGYGVPDGDTVPSFLQERLGRVGGKPVRVYNFGRSAYYSTQERILFERLVTAGHVPDAVVFVDGLNEFSTVDDVPFGAAFLRERAALRGAGWAQALRTLADLLPLTTTARHLARLMGIEDAAQPAAPSRFDDPEVADHVLARWVRSKTLIEGGARASGVSATFVWQPIPTYGGADVEAEARAPVSNRAAFGYRRMAAYAAEHPLGPRFVWCAEPGDGALERLYVDAVHYGPVMADRVARCIADAMLARGLVP